jgi:hypothetical protein
MNAPKQVHGKLEMKGLFTRDLRIGVSGVYGYISPQPAAVRPALPDAGIFEYIGNVYIAHASYPFTFISEGYVIQHESGTLKRFTYDAFAVVGYTVGVATPYLSAERVATSGGSDPFFIPDPTAPTLQLNVAEGIAGLRIDTSTWSSVKIEYRFERDMDRSTTLHTGYASWQFGI